MAGRNAGRNFAVEQLGHRSRSIAVDGQVPARRHERRVGAPNLSSPERGRAVKPKPQFFGRVVPRTVVTLVLYWVVCVLGGARNGPTKPILKKGRSRFPAAVSDVWTPHLVHEAV
jgi:hypothetical protein